MEKRLLRYAFWILVPWVTPLCFGQTIKIRVVNDKTGQPLPKQPISITLLYEKGEKTPAKYDAALNIETDEKGESQFNLPEPAPAHLAAQVHLTSEHWFCGCSVLVTTQDLIQKGIAGPRPVKSGNPVKAEPKEIMFFAHPFTLLERLLYPFVKG
jgi:hypothetical protein